MTHRILRTALAAVTTFVLIFLVPIASALAQNGVAGRWEGSYECGGAGKASMTLEVSEGGPLLEGVFSFEVQGRRGSYKVAGRLQPSGQFAFVPRGWIDRPTGFTALGIEGMLNQNGRSIEGRLSPCMMSTFRAARVLPATETLPEAQAAQPLSGGQMAGNWAGGIRCRGSRRGQFDTYPVALQLFADGSGVGGLATVDISPRGKVSGSLRQQVLLSGLSENNQLQLNRQLVVDKGGAAIELRSIDLALLPSAQLEGRVRLSGCDEIRLTRKGASQPVALPHDLAGLWSAVSGTGDAAIALHVLEDGSMVELRASSPASAPEPQRDRLRLALAPVKQEGNRTLLVPVSYRQATGLFCRSHARHSCAYRHPRVRAGAQRERRNRTARRTAGGRRDRSAGRSRPVTDGGKRRSMTFSRPSEGQAKAMAAGEVPPINFGPDDGGALAAAASREGQCRVLEAWLAPYAGKVDIDRMALTNVIAELSVAFSDQVFEPVFGVPPLLTTQQERTAIGRLAVETCQKGLNMRLVGLVGNFVFMTDHQFLGLSTMMTDRSEANEWVLQIEKEISDLPPEPGSLGRLDAIGGELRTRERDLPKDTVSRLQQGTGERAREIQISLFMAEAEALPETGFETGALDQVLAFMERLERADFRGDGAAVRARAQAKATAILLEPLRRAAGVAPQLAPSLEGLKPGKGELMPRAISGRMDASSDRSIHKRPGTALPAMAQIEGDRDVRTALREKLSEVEPGSDPKASVTAVAAAYLDMDAVQGSPETRGNGGDGSRNGRGSSGIRDRSGRQPQRRRTNGAGDRAVRVAAGPPVQRGECRDRRRLLVGDRRRSGSSHGLLSQPGLMTGQRGFGARLIEVGYRLPDGDRRDTVSVLSFTQQIRINLPGGEAFGGKRSRQWQSVCRGTKRSSPVHPGGRGWVEHRLRRSQLRAI